MAHGGFLLCSSKKGMSAHQLHRMLDITYKTAWFMAHRIRFAKGTVEADETFVGGKGERKTRYDRRTPVVALIERKGKVRTKVVASVTQRIFAPVWPNARPKTRLSIQTKLAFTSVCKSISNGMP